MNPLLIATAAGSAVVGFGIGYKVAQKRLEMEFERRLERETAGMKEFYQVVKKPFSTPQEAAAELIKEDPQPKQSTAEKANEKVAYHKIAKQYSPEKDPEGQVGIDADVFGESDRPMLIAEVENHNVFSEIPVLISQEEFMANESNYIQGQLSYYKVDKVLTDEREDVIEDQDATIGASNLEMFGNPNNGSSDPNVIHVRNPRLQMEFEVCLSENSYRREVLGIEEDPPIRPSGRDK